MMLLALIKKKIVNFFDRKLTKKHDVHPCPAVLKKNRYSIQLVAKEKT